MGDGDGGGAAPTKEEFIAEADALCAEALDANATEFQELLAGNPSDEEVADFVIEVGVPRTRAVLEDLMALTPPAGDEDTLQAVWDAVEDGNAELESEPSIVTTQSAVSDYETADELAGEYGLDDCARF